MALMVVDSRRDVAVEELGGVDSGCDVVVERGAGQVLVKPTLAWPDLGIHDGQDEVGVGDDDGVRGKVMELSLNHRCQIWQWWRNSY